MMLLLLILVVILIMIILITTVIVLLITTITINIIIKKCRPISGSAPRRPGGRPRRISQVGNLAIEIKPPTTKQTYRFSSNKRFSLYKTYCITNIVFFLTKNDMFSFCGKFLFFDFFLFFKIIFLIFELPT